MKTIALITMVLFIWKPEATNDNNDATVSIFRKGRFTGVAVNYQISVDGQDICALSNNKYINVKLSVGEHTITSKANGLGYLSNPQSSIKITVEKDQSYFLTATARLKGVSGFLELAKIDVQEAEKIKQKVKNFDNCQKKL